MKTLLAVRRALWTLASVVVWFGSLFHSQAQQAIFSAAAADSSGNAIYSLDGSNWLASPFGMPFDISWQRVVYGSGKFVAIPWDAANVAYSVDGVTWAASSGSLPHADGWADLVYGGGKFVTIGYGTTNAAYSCDGIHWSNASLPSVQDWNCVSYGNGIFVTIAAYTNVAAYSSDGIHWSSSSLMPYNAYWQCVTYGNGVFAALVGGNSEAAYSTNGINWVAATNLPYNNWGSITFGNGMFIAVAYGSSETAYSTNGITWQAATNAALAFWYSSAYADYYSPIFVAPAIQSSNASYSFNGIHWFNSPSGLPDADTWYTVGARQGPLIVTQPQAQTASVGDNVNFSVNAIGSGTLTYQWQLNGTNVAGASGATLALANVQVSQIGNYSVTVSNAGGWTESSGAYLLVWSLQQPALFSAVAGNNLNAMYSMDGMNWSSSPTGMPALANWSRVAYGDNKYVAIAWGDTNVAYSLDGISWLASPGLSSAQDWADVVYGNGRFVTVAYGASLGATSVNGTNWTTNALPANNSWYSLGFANGLFVCIAANDSGAIYSSDGIHWSSSLTGIPTNQDWQGGQGIAFGNNVYAAIVGSQSAVYSTDGSNWHNATGLPSANWASIAFGNGEFIAVAYGSSEMAYTPNGTNWQTSTIPYSTWYSSAFADYGSGIFAVLSMQSTGAAYSTNGISWYNSPSGLPDADTIYTVCARQNPEITTQPQSQSLVVGTNTMLTVTATGPGTLSYQWLSNGVPISGATTSSLNLTALSASGDYQCVVANFGGSMTSSVADVTVVSVASLQPVGNTNCQLVSSNSTLQTWSIPLSTNPVVTNLEIIAGSSPALPPSQLPSGWLLNGVLTNVVNIGITNPGVWTVVCTAGTSAITNVIWVMENGDVEQGCPITGSNLLGYWSFDDPGPWGGSLGQQPLAVVDVQNPTSPWRNAVRVNTNVSANLSYPYMQSNGLPNIDCINGAASFWFKPDWNGGAGPGNPGRLLEMGDTNSSNGWWSLWLDSAGSTIYFQSRSNGVLTTYFSNSIANWSSSDWYQLVLDYSTNETALYTNGVLAQTGPGISSFPTIGNRLEYGFSIGSDHTGEDQIRGTIDELYTFACPLTASEVVNGTSGYIGYLGYGAPSVTNESSAPSILTQPVSQTVGDGSSVTFSAFAIGTPALGYQWTSNGSIIAGATASIYTIPDVQAPDAGSYAVVVTNSFGSVTSATATLSRTNSPPTFVYTPISQMVIEGDTVTFSARAVGSEPIFYRWQEYDGFRFTGIPNQNSNRLVFFNMQSGDVGTYAIVASNAVGASSYTNAVLGDVPGAVPYSTLMTVIGPRQDYTFRANTTYVIESNSLSTNANVDLYGTTTIEGGTVIKFNFDPVEFSSVASLALHGPLVCDTGSYNPAILTSLEDSSQGEADFVYQDQLWYYFRLPGLPNFPTNALNGYAYLNLDDVHDSNPTCISNLRFCYADQAVTTPTNSGILEVWNCQFLNCNSALNAKAPRVGSTNSLHNVLFSSCGDVVAAETNLAELDGEQVTVDASYLCAPEFPVGRIFLTNSVIVADVINGPTVSGQDLLLNPDSLPFVSCDDASYYLSPLSACHAAGTTNISPQLLQLLRQKTTMAPISLSGTTPFSLLNSYSYSNALGISEMTLLPTVKRYIGGAPDLGYYYDALDYSVAAVLVTNELNVLPGTALAIRNDFFGGFFLQDGSAFVAKGTPTNPIIFTDIGLVQEGPISPGLAYQPAMDIYSIFSYGGIAFLCPQAGATHSPVVKTRFCDFYSTEDDCIISAGAAPGAYHFPDFPNALAPASSVNWTMQDCYSRGGQINLGETLQETNLAGAIFWTNNIFDSVFIDLDPTTNVDFTVFAENNLFKVDGWVPTFLAPPMVIISPTNSQSAWTFMNNFFDYVQVVQDPAGPINPGYNGYWPARYDPNSANPINIEWQLGTALTNYSITPGIQHDVFLTTAPDYQTGPLGNCYMPTGTLLANAGSTNASLLALYEYTATTNEQPQGDARVDIGAHYLVATNIGGIWTPIVTNSIPIYLADVNGNGLISTSATNAANAFYGNVDLDGDGMVGLVEAALHTDPLSFDNPLTLNQVGNISGSGVVTFVVTNAYIPSAGQLELMVDGISVSTSSTTDANGDPELTWNTGGYPSGQTNFLQAYFVLAASAATADGPLRPFVIPNTAPQSQSITNGQGGTATIGSPVAGPGPNTYQWCWGTNLIVGATNDVYVITNLTSSDAGNYTVVVTSADGNVLSDTTALVVSSANIGITTQPMTQTVFIPDSVSFAVSAVGANLSYQWQRIEGNPASSNYGAWVDIPNATGSNYTIISLTSNNVTTYSVRLSNASGSVQSQSAVLTNGGPMNWPCMFVIGPRQNYTFQNGITYVVGYPGCPPLVDLYGNTTIQAGAVIKFDSDFQTNAPGLRVHGNFRCAGEPYRPAMLTSSDDDSEGEIIGGWFFTYGQPPSPPGMFSGGNAETARLGVTYLNLDDVSNPVTVTNLRISYADQGITTPTNSGILELWDSQFLECNIAIGGSPASRSTNVLHNVLFSACGLAVSTGGNYSEIDGEQVTANVGEFCDDAYLPSSVHMTNSIILGSPPHGSVTSLLSVVNPSDWPFQYCDDGSYYLPSWSPYRASGSANISAGMRAELTRKCTSAPISIAPGLEVTGQITLAPQAARYTGGAPDIGYYYDALDYTFGDLLVSEGSILVVRGTAIGFRNDFPGNIGLENDCLFSAQGTPGQPIEFVDNSLVQEGPFAPGETYNEYWGKYMWAGNFLAGTNVYGGHAFFMPSIATNDSVDPAPEIDLRFCNFDMTADDFAVEAGFSFGTEAYALNGFTGTPLAPASSVTFTMQDCNIRGGQIVLGNEIDSATNPPGVLCWTNDLFENTSIILEPGSDPDNNMPYVDLPVTIYNCLFRNGLLALAPTSTSQGYWQLEDCLFDNEQFWQDQSQPLEYNFNAYWTNTTPSSNLFTLLVGSTASKLFPGGLSTNGANDLVLSGPPAYVQGTFGQYYQPPNSALLYQGSTRANALGLNAFTVLTNGAEEGTNKVSIGLHYVAVDSNGNPDSSGTNGLQDWWEYAYYGSLGINPTNLATNGDGYTVSELYQLGLDPNLAYPNPMILQAPMDEEVYIGGTANFTVIAGGSLPLSYQWFFDGNPIAGATSSALAISPTQLTNSGGYTVTVTSVDQANNTNQVPSQIATLAVLNDFALRVQPDSAVYPGRSVQFTLNSSASIGTSFQWYFNGTNISNATNDFLLLTNAQPTNAGYYSISVNGMSPTNLIVYLGILTVAPAPTANADVFTISQGSTFNQFDVLANDTFTVGSLTISNYTQPTNGTIASDGQYIYYTPSNSSYVGADVFTYTAVDQLNVASTATVFVFTTADGANILNAQDFTVTLQTNVFTTEIDLGTNSWNPGTIITVYSPGAPTMGTVTSVGSVITYIRNTNRYGPDSFLYTITDGLGDWAQGTITVDQTNAAGDGIPDQWKLRYGLSTVTNIASEDPDGDGVPNLAEYALGTDPLVADNPLGLATAPVPVTISGYVRIPLMLLSSNINQDMVKFQLYADGAPVNSEIVNVDGGWYADWDTITTPNGAYELSLQCSYDCTTLDTNPVVSGAPAVVTVDNPITLDVDSSRYEGQVNIIANVNQASRWYTIDLYDHVTGGYLTTLSGPVVGGAINTSWDLSGWAGGHPVEAAIQIVPELERMEEPIPQPTPKPKPQPSPPPARPLIALDEDSGNDNFYYTIATGEADAPYVYLIHLAVAQTFGTVNNLDTLADDTTDYKLLPFSGSSGGNIPYASTFLWATPGDTVNLAVSLLTSDNFFYLGHGNFDRIGNGLGASTRLTANRIADWRVKRSQGMSSGRSAFFFGQTEG